MDDVDSVRCVSCFEVLFLRLGGGENVSSLFTQHLPSSVTRDAACLVRCEHGVVDERLTPSPHRRIKQDSGVLGENHLIVKVLADAEQGVQFASLQRTRKDRKNRAKVNTVVNKQAAPTKSVGLRQHNKHSEFTRCVFRLASARQLAQLPHRKTY